MSTAAVPTQGTLIKIGNGATPEVFSTIPEIKGFTGPSGSASTIDVTTINSDKKEKKMGIADEGQMSLTLNYLPTNAQHIALREARNDRTETNFEIVFADDSPSTTWSFTGYVTGFSVTGSVDNVIEASVTIEITGSIIES